MLVLQKLGNIFLVEIHLRDPCFLVFPPITKNASVSENETTKPRILWAHRSACASRGALWDM